MKIEIPKITVAIDLGEYTEALRGRCVQVHVNPSRAFRRKRIEALEKLKSKLGDEAAALEFQASVQAWFAELWSQGDDPALRWTADEIKALDESDPSLMLWLVERSMRAIEDHRTGEKKS